MRDKRFLDRQEKIDQIMCTILHITNLLNAYNFSRYFIQKLIVIKGADYSLRTGWRIKLYSYEMQKFSVCKLSLIILSVTIYIYSAMNGFIEHDVI